MKEEVMLILKHLTLKKNFILCIVDICLRLLISLPTTDLGHGRYSSDMTAATAKYNFM